MGPTERPFGSLGIPRDSKKGNQGAMQGFLAVVRSPNGLQIVLGRPIAALRELKALTVLSLSRNIRRLPCLPQAFLAIPSKDRRISKYDPLWSLLILMGSQLGPS